MCCLYRMRSDLLSLISTALFMALNTKGSEMCFNYINCNDRASAHKMLLSKAMSNQPRYKECKDV